MKNRTTMMVSHKFYSFCSYSLFFFTPPPNFYCFTCLSCTEEGGGDAGGFGNMQEMFANLNSGAAPKPNFDDFGEEEKEDSDDEEIPNLE